MPTDLITKEPSRQRTCEWVTQASRAGFIRGEGGGGLIPPICTYFAKSVNPTFAKQIGINIASVFFGSFWDTMASENLELSWKGLKIFGIFRKSSVVNLIRNLKKKMNNLTDLPRSICVNVRQMWIAFLSWSLLLELRRLKFGLDHIFRFARISGLT